MVAPRGAVVEIPRGELLGFIEADVGYCAGGWEDVVLVGLVGE